MASAAAELFVKVSASLDGLLGGFRKAGDAADGMAAKVSETQEALRKLADEDEGIKRARTAAAALGKEFDLVAEAVKHTEQAVIALSKKGLGPGNAEFDKAIKNLKIARDAHEAAAAATQQTVKATSNLKDVIGGVAIGTLLADGIKSAASAMADMATQSVTLAGELEQNKVAFNVLLGSAEKAGAFLRDLQGFAANTPFELRGLTEASKRLLAFGFNAESIIPMLTAVGNASMGNAEKIDRITTALGQMAAKGKVSAEEMNQLQEAGIKGWEMVGTAIGKSAAEAAKMAEKGQIDAATAVTALLNGMQGKFGGMMEAQSKTFNGVMSNLRDSADQALTAIGDSFIKNLRLVPLIQTIAGAVNNLTAAFTSGGLIAAIDMAFGPTTKAAIVGLGVAITAAMVPAITSATASLIATAAAAAPFLALAGAIAFAAFPIIKYWGEIRGTITALWDTAAQYTAAYYNRAVRIVSDLASNFATAFQYIGDTIRSILGDELTNRLLGGLRRTAGAFRGFAETAVTPLRVIGSVVSVAASNFAETWGDAMTASTGFTNGLFSSAAASSAQFSKKITAELLGLKKAGATSDDLAKAAKKLEAEQHKAEAAAQKHAAALERLHVAGAKAYERFEAMAAALLKVRAGIRTAEADGDKLGRSFDLAGAKAAAIKDGLPGVEAAFGKFSPQAAGLREQMTQLAVASANGGKATADAFKVLDGAAMSIEAAQQKAALLGDEFDANAAAVSQYSRAVQDLMEQGLKPGNAQLDEAVRRYNAAVEAQKKAAEAAKTFTQRLEEITSSGRAVYSALTDMADVFGLKLPPAITKVIDGIFTLSAGFNTLMTVGPKLLDAIMPALTTIAAAAMANPVVAIVAGITLAVGAGVWAWHEYQKSSTAAMEAASAAAQELEANNQLALESSDLALRTQQAEFQAMVKRSESAFASVKEAANQGFRDSLSAFMAGASNYGEILRDRLREGMAQAIMDNLVAKGITDKFNDYFTKISENIEKGMGDANKVLLDELGQKIIQQVEGLGEVGKKLFEAIGAVSPGAAAMAKQASDEAARLRAAHASTLSTIYGNLERGSPNSERLLAQARILQGRAQPGDEALARGMALGGLVTGPTFARMGEGGRDEAVLPLNDRVYRSIAEGIAHAGASGATVVVNYTGSGKWTREDAQGLGRLLVSELRAMGVRA